MKLASFVSCLVAAWLALPVPTATAAPTCGPADELRLGGAYRLPGGAVASIVPEGNEGAWRITHFDTGRSHRLHPGDRAAQFHSAADWDSATPVALQYAFGLDGAGHAQALHIRQAGQPARTAPKIALRERPAAFISAGAELQGRLTLPASGRGPFKTVVFVHGSDPLPSTGREWLPHLLASQGVATLVFDKRGTGCSTGTYVQHFDTLSDDVVAAVRWLQAQPEVDAARIGLAGFSQGGWVAPLAALKEPAVRFVAVAYGLAMSLADEDRLEAPLKLKELGVDAASVAEYEQLNAALHRLARDDFRDWSEFDSLLERFKDRPWLAVAKGQPSWVGVALQMGPQQAKAVAPQMFRSFFQPFYEPVPTLEKLPQPMLWLIAGQDIEAPPGPTLQALERLRAQGKPLRVKVFPGADHGLQDFVLRDGRRVRTAYAEGYFQTLSNWVRKTR